MEARCPLGVRQRLAKQGNPLGGLTQFSSSQTQRNPGPNRGFSKTVLFAVSERFQCGSLRPREFSEHGMQIGGPDLRERGDVWNALSSLQDSLHALNTLAGSIGVSGNPCVPTSQAKDS